ncbi:hypothetical protein FVER53590_06572 [Fusarium verticillioides]|nr:hypothetical protein FVER53590_06572 [Fusarium verticillioides]
MKFSIAYALTAISAVSAAGCPAPGQTNATGDESCDPAKDYPGEACVLLNDGCHYLRGLGLITATATTAAAKPTSTCPAAGKTNAAGDTSCDPAKDYPGKACVLLNDGCHYLRGLGLITATATTAAAKPTSTCPAAGKANAAGDTSCDPAKDYPGEACVLLNDGCHYLRGLGLDTATATTAAAKPTSTCPAAGKTNAAGNTSCDPAKDYPGEACVLLNDGCHYLRGLGLGTATAVPTPVIVNGAAQLPAMGGSVLAGLLACLL